MEKERMWASTKELCIDVKVLHTSFKSCRMAVGKLTKAASKSGAGATQLSPRNQWLVDHFGFMTQHIYQHRGLTTGRLVALIMQQSRVVSPIEEGSDEDGDGDGDDDEDGDDDQLSQITSRGPDTHTHTHSHGCSSSAYGYGHCRNPTQPEEEAQDHAQGLG